MFGMTHRNLFDEVFSFQREFERLFDRFWNELPSRTAGSLDAGLRVTSNDDGWRVDVPMPGIDPKDVTVEAAGNTLTIRAVEAEDEKSDKRSVRYEQTVTVPQFLDIDKVSASHRHGMLQLTLPLKDAVKPRRIQIQGVAEGQKQIAAAA